MNRALALSLAALLGVLGTSGPLVATAAPASGASAGTVPASLQRIGYDQRVGGQIPLDLAFRDEAGREVRLGRYFNQRPVVLVLAYYGCPMLCGVVLSDLAAALKVLPFDAGKEYEVVVVSIAPDETPAMAAKAKKEAIARIGRSGQEPGWHFLTGSPAAIRSLTGRVGFRYYYDESSRQYAHAAGVVVLTPAGRLSRYLLGIEYPPRDLRLALVESAGGRIGSAVDQLLLYCFHYDPSIGRYSATAMNILRLAAVATVLGLALLVILLRRRETPEPGLQGIV
jgi:protein SCO1/2